MNKPIQFKQIRKDRISAERRKQGLTEEVSSTRTFCSPDFSRLFWGKVLGEDKNKTSFKQFIKLHRRNKKDLNSSKKGENQSFPCSTPPRGLLIWGGGNETIIFPISFTELVQSLNFVNAYEKYESYPMIHMQRIILMIISSLSIKRTQSPDTTKSTSKLTVQCITSISLLVYLSKYTLLRVDPSIF